MTLRKTAFIVNFLIGPRNKTFLLYQTISNVFAIEIHQIIKNL